MPIPDNLSITSGLRSSLEIDKTTVVLDSRSEIANLRLAAKRIVVNGFASKGDYGSGASYVVGVQSGPMAIQSASNIWYNLDISVQRHNPGWWGVVGDRVTDDTAAMRNLVTWLQGKSKIVESRDAKIRLTSQINIDDQIHFVGAGFRSLPGYDQSTLVKKPDTDLSTYTGLVFYVDFLISTTVSGNNGLGVSGDTYTFYNGQVAAFFVRGEGVRFENLEFQCNQTPIPDQSYTGNWAPRECAWAIRVHGRTYFTDGFGLTIRNVMLRNMTYGICIFNAAQVTVEGIKGQCFKNSLIVTRMKDVSTFRSLWNGWTYWSGHASIMAFQLANTVAFSFGRFDGACLYDIFAFYNTVPVKFFQDNEPNASLSGEAGSSTRTRLYGVYCDGCHFGIISEDSASWSVFGLTVYGVLSGGSTGILIQDKSGFATPATIEVNGADFQGLTGSAILAQKKSLIQVSNVRVLSWNVPTSFVPGADPASQPNGAGAPAFEGIPSSVMQLSNVTWYDKQGAGGDWNNPFGGYGGSRFGSATIQWSPSVKASSTNDSGYKQTDDGLIQQWGVASVSSSGTSTINFPIPFTGKCFNVIANAYAIGANSNYSIVARVDSWTNSSFVVVCTSTGPTGTTAPQACNINFQAFGRMV